MYLAVEHRREISLSHIQTHVLRRCTLVRYQSSLYTDAPTSSLYLDEIPVFLIYRHMYLAVEHRREISLSYLQTHVLRRCISARYQSSLYTDAPTSPMFNGEIPVFLIYRHMYLAVEHRREISLSCIQTHVLRRCISARYQFSLYTDGSTSPMLNGEISVFLIYRHMYLAAVHRQGTSLIYRRIYLAVVHRRGGGSIFDYLLNDTYCEIGEFCFVLYIETVT